MSWLVTGGAGYIGAHVVSASRAIGDDVVVLDDLSTGDPCRMEGAPLVRGTVLDRALVEATIREHAVHGVVHLAGKKRVEESVRRPLYYYRENFEGLRTLLEAVTATRVPYFVFSSSAAVYGAPDVALVDEEMTTCLPVNPYGSTKLVGERLIAEVAAATGLADRGATNLVPMVFERLQQGLPPQIFGDDYDTFDGICVRDFVHVSDIASAHVAATRALLRGLVTELTVNIGRGEGVSVRDLVSAARTASGTADAAWAEPAVAPRRAGDPPRVVASVERIHELLGWKARLGVEEMVTSAWEGWVAARALRAPGAPSRL